MSAIGSGALDVNGLVQQLMSAERAPLSLRFNRAEATAKAKISAFGTLSAAFNALKSAVGALKGSTAFEGRSAKSSNESIFSASAGATVATGTYAVEVLKLASVDKLTTAALDSGVDLGEGQLSITVGSTSFTVDIDAAESTPSEIAAKINEAATLAGAKLNVTLVTSDDGQHVVFNGTERGLANAVTVSNTSAPANAALDAFVNANLTANSSAADAEVKVDGLLRTGTGNTFTNIIAGLSLTLKAADPGTEHTLTVSVDNSAGRKLVQDLVTAYNGAIKAVTGTTRYNAETNTPSSLTGDAAARGAGTQLRNALGSALNALSEAGLDIGIRSAVDGSLSLDTAKFDAALAADPGAVTSLLSGSNSLASRLEAVVGAYVGSDGIFTARTDSLNGTLKRVASEREAGERRLASIERRYRAQFTALDAMVSRMQSTSNFLAQQLASLPGADSRRR